MTLTLLAPWEPPITITTGLLAVNPHNSKAANLLPVVNSLRIGDPVRIAFPLGTYLVVSGKLQHTFVATGIHNLFAYPGVISDS